MTFLESIDVTLPLVQAPMAGVSTPRMAAEVSNAGALGSIAVGATDAAGATTMIRELKSLTTRAFNVNLFVHTAPRSDPAVEAAWLQALTPTFRSLGAEPPASLKPAYPSFMTDDSMMAVLLDEAPPVVSFHFGLPDAGRIRALKQVGCRLIATATCLDEALACRAAGMDAVTAQGYEAGGHRGMFDPDADDDRLNTHDLTRLLVVRSDLPVIAAGGIMDGAGLRAALDRGAIAGQLGTAFIDCPESAADAPYRALLHSDAARQTVMTRVLSGRPARCLSNRFTTLGRTITAAVPDYPVAYDAGKALNAAAKAAGETGFAAQWAGAGAPFARSLPAGDLVALLIRELAEAT